jgi:hypothetical protein
MTVFILSAAKGVAANQIIADPKAMLDAGHLTAYTERGNGTTRHLELAPIGSTRRDTAEWISEQVEDGRSLRAVANELHVSLPTVRRHLMALELTEDIEAGEYDQVWAEAQELPYTEPADTADADTEAEVLVTVYL